jgi:hypothetical protein
MGTNIPLPALDIAQAPASPPPNALAEFERASQLQTQAAQRQQIQAQTQLTQQQGQMQAMQLKDEQLRRSLAPQFVQKDENGKPTGFDTEGLYNAMLQGGADPMSIQAMRMKQAEMQKSLIGLGDAQIEHQQKVNGFLVDGIESVRDANDKALSKQTGGATVVPQNAGGTPQTVTPQGAQPQGIPQDIARPPEIGAAQPGSPVSLGAPEPGTAPTGTESALQDAAKAPKPITPEAQAAYQQFLVRAARMGIPIGQFKPTLTDTSDLDQAEAGAGLHAELLSQQQKAAELAKATSEGNKAQAEAEASQWKPAGEGTLVNFKTGQMIHGVAPVEMQEMQDWIKDHPGKGPADFLHYKSTLPINTRYALESGAGVPGAPTGGTPADTAKHFGMTQEAFDQAAEKYYTSGQLPQLGRGISGIALNRELMNRAGELHPGASLAENSAAFKANQQSLGKIQTNFDQVTAFENTAGKNLDLFLQTAKPILDSGSPWINTPLRKVDAGALGSADQAAFNAARQTAVTEIAKVLNSSNASGVLSDSARHEVEGLIGPNATLRQIASAASVLRQDMGNRHQAYQEQINDIQNRMKTGGGNQNASPAKDFFSQFGGTARNQ